jgi:hypothetical protein
MAPLALPEIDDNHQALGSRQPPQLSQEVLALAHGG